MNTFELFERYSFKTYSRFPVSFVRGEGVWLYDESGRRYLDLLAGIAVCCLGHSHRRLYEAICDQAKKLVHVSNLFYEPLQGELARKLSEISFGGRVFFCNSGAEANEGALKLSRYFFWKRGLSKWKVITFEGSFHGRTFATLSATGQEKVKKGFHPVMDSFVHLPFGELDPVRWAVEGDEHIGAIMVEPVQGEGGVRVPPEGFLKGLREIADSYNILLIFDEVQTGMGRSGKFFCYQVFGVEPDIMTLAKGLGGGVPIGAIVAKENIALSMDPGSHASTFGGNPLACRASLEVIKVIEEEGLLDRVRKVGSYALKKLSEIKSAFSGEVRDVRGVGLLIGVEFSFDTFKIVRDLLERGIVVGCSGNVLRIAPPFYVEEEHIDALCDELSFLLRNRRYGIEEGS